MSTSSPVRRAALAVVEAARPLVGPPCLHDPPHGLRATARVLAEKAATPLVPTRRLLDRLPPPPPFRLVAVYRRRNAARIETLAATVSAGTALWSLDEVAPALADRTVGAGPGTRFANLNRVLPAPDDRTWLVIADDDVALPGATLADAVALARRAGVDLAMPGHGPGSAVNWESTRARPGSVVRLTRFVDQGPLLVLSPAAQRALLPLDEGLGMGWGVELRWGARSELRTGILDAVRMTHLSPVTRGGYDVDAEWARAEDLLARSPWGTWAQAQRELDRWPRGRRAPGWGVRG